MDQEVKILQMVRKDNHLPYVRQPPQGTIATDDNLANDYAELSEWLPYQSTLFADLCFILVQQGFQLTSYTIGAYMS